MDNETMTIKQADTRNGHIPEPFRSILNDFASGQESLAQMQRAADIRRSVENYRSFQGLRDLLRAWLENEEIVHTLSREQYDAARAELSEADRF